MDMITQAIALNQVQYIAHQNGTKRHPELFRIQVRGSEQWEDIPNEMGRHLLETADSRRQIKLSLWTRWPAKKSDNRDANWHVHRIGPLGQLDPDLAEYEEYLRTVRSVSIYEGA